MSRPALERALLAAMERAAAEPMQWGRDDCALWCADILQEALGYDAASRFRGRYRTRIGARRVLGGKGLAGALRGAARRHGWHRIDVEDTQSGDIGLAVMGDTISIVICRASGWFIGRNERGWTALPATAIRTAWSVLP